MSQRNQTITNTKQHVMNKTEQFCDHPKGFENKRTFDRSGLTLNGLKMERASGKSCALNSSGIAPYRSSLRYPPDPTYEQIESTHKLWRKRTSVYIHFETPMFYRLHISYIINILFSYSENFAVFNLFSANLMMLTGIDQM